VSRFSICDVLTSIETLFHTFEGDLTIG
jgi:hypothetical protein